MKNIMSFVVLTQNNLCKIIPKTNVYMSLYLCYISKNVYFTPLQLDRPKRKIKQNTLKYFLI